MALMQYYMQTKLIEFLINHLWWRCVFNQLYGAYVFVKLFDL